MNRSVNNRRHTGQGRGAFIARLTHTLVIAFGSEGPF